MLTLTAIRNDLTTTFQTTRGRRLWKTWTKNHPILTTYETPIRAITAAQNHAADADEILNAFLSLSASEPYARQAIVVAFQPWIAAHIGTHRVPRRDGDDHTATLIAAFIDAAVTLAPGAPHLWPATTITHAAYNPIRRHYRHLTRTAQPVGPASELEESLNLRIHHPSSCATSGPELVISGLIKHVHAGTITLEEANIVARLVSNGQSARRQAAHLFVSPRVAQRRVHKVANHLIATAA
jgi:hypothetical protein